MNNVDKISSVLLQPNISSRQVEQIMGYLPPLDLQNQFADFVKQVDKSKFVVASMLREISLIADLSNCIGDIA